MNHTSNGTVGFIPILVGAGAAIVSAVAAASAVAASIAPVVAAIGVAIVAGQSAISEIEKWLPQTGVQFPFTEMLKEFAVQVDSGVYDSRLTNEGYMPLRNETLREFTSISTPEVGQLAAGILAGRFQRLVNERAKHETVTSPDVLTSDRISISKSGSTNGTSKTSWVPWILVGLAAVAGGIYFVQVHKPTKARRSRRTP